MTVFSIWFQGPDAVQLALAVGGLSALLAGLLAKASDRRQSRRFILISAALLAALVSYSLITSWLLARPPPAT